MISFYSDYLRPTDPTPGSTWPLQAEQGETDKTNT